MKRIGSALAGPAGPFFVWIIVLIGLIVRPGVDVEILVGSAVGQLTDPLVLLATLITAFAAHRWWHVCVGAGLIGLYEGLRPHSSALAEQPGMLAVYALAGFLSVSVVSAIASGARCLIRRPKAVTQD